MQAEKKNEVIKKTKFAYQEQFSLVRKPHPSAVADK